MVVTPLHTDPITVGSHTLHDLIDTFVPHIQERSVLAITSKIVSLCEKRVVPLSASTKKELAMQEADWYIPASAQSYNHVLAIKDHALVISAGVDSRNTNGYYVLFPEHIQQTVNEIWTYLRTTRGLSELGVMITDSHTSPLRKGVIGFCVGWCGFDAYNPNHTHDVFGASMSGPVNVADALSTAAVYTMGETHEQTPLALLTDIPHIQFIDHPPTKEDIEKIYLRPEEDIYATVLLSAPWEKKKTSL